MVRVIVNEAQADLAKLIKLACEGEEILVVDTDVPIACIVPIRQLKFKVGLLKGRALGHGPDFIAPLDLSEIELWEEGQNSKTTS